MTDRFNALVVSLDRDIRDDDAKAIINAILMLKGVDGVTGNIVDPTDFAASQKFERIIRQHFMNMLNDINKL